MWGGAAAVLATAFVAMLVAVVAMAAWTDVRSRRIPNWLCAVNLALGLSYIGLAFEETGGGWTAVGMAGVHIAVALLLTMGLFALGIIGAGDAKFYTSMAAWVPLDDGLALLVSVALAGLALLGVFVALRFPGRARRNSEQKTHFDKLPFGVAIGLGGLAAVVLA